MPLLRSLSLFWRTFYKYAAPTALGMPPGQIGAYFFSPFFVVEGLAAFGDGRDACAACKRHFWRERLSIVAGSNFSKNAFCSRADSSGVIGFLVVVPSRFRMNISSIVGTFPLNESIRN